MSFDVRPTRDADEFKAAFFGIGQYFGGPPSEEGLQRWIDQLTLERMHAAFSDGAVVGGAGAFTFDMTVPGGSVPTGGVTVVGVYPTHRRRGVLRGLMRAQLDDIHERGEPTAALWASEETIYGRFGYGLASWCGEISLAHEYTAFAAPAEPAGTIRLIEPDEALQALPAVYERVRLQWPGMFSRNRLWWEHREIDDPESRRDGAGPKRWVVHERDGEIDGYAV
jgi:predicted acetyltransferase